MAMTNSVAPTPALPQWAIDFCSNYTPFLFDWGRWMLAIGVVLGILLAIAAIAAEIRKPTDDAAAKARLARANAPGAGVVLETLKGFLQALSSLPTWLAIFGGGVLLLWMAGNTTPEICKPKPECPEGYKCTKTSPTDRDGNAPGNSASTNSSVTETGG